MSKPETSVVPAEFAGMEKVLSETHFDDSETVALVSKASAFPAIASEEQALQVAEVAKGLHAVKDRIGLFFNGMAGYFDKLHKTVTGARGVELKKVQKGLDVCSKLLYEWEQEKERQRKAEQARLERIAKEAAEKERIERAQEAFEEGETEEAAAILEEDVMPPAVLSVPKQKSETGFSPRTTYTAQLADANGKPAVQWSFAQLQQMIQLAADGKIAPQYLMPNLKFAEQQAKALKDQFSVPGFRLVRKGGMSRR